MRPLTPVTQVDLQAELHGDRDWDNTLTANRLFPPAPALSHYKYPTHTAEMPRGKTVLNVSRFRVHDAAIANPGTDHARTVRIKRLALGDTALKPYPKDAEHEAVYLVR